MLTVTREIGTRCQTALNEHEKDEYRVGGTLPIVLFVGHLTPFPSSIAAQISKMPFENRPDDELRSMRGMVRRAVSARSVLAVTGRR